MDGALRTLGISLEIGAGIERSRGYLRQLLVSLSRQMKGAFLGEVARLRGRIRTITETAARGKAWIASWMSLPGKGRPEWVYDG